MAKSAKGGKVALISAHAKATRKPNEAWTKAIQRASKELKKLGKI
jgi:hypothetical protein